MSARERMITALQAQANVNRALVAVLVARAGGSMTVTPDEMRRAMTGLLPLSLRPSPVGGVEMSVLELEGTPVEVTTEPAE